ncbi:hypothetical protein D3C86_1922450 [compost metagenome]
MLPALALVADHPGRHHMLPFQALRAAWLLAHLVAAAGQVDPLAVVGAAAIEGARSFGVKPPGDFLGGGEVWRGVGVDGDGEQQAEQGDQARHAGLWAKSCA